MLPSVVGQMVAARGAEESTAWRQPVDLVALCDEAASQLPELFAARPRRAWLVGPRGARRELLGDDPAGIIDALKAAIRAGAAPADLGRSLAYAAALRVARFGNANEHADWETAHHVFTYANALHQMLKRIGTANTDGPVTAVRGVLHGAMALYLTRYLNVPPARMPGEHGDRLDDLPADAETIRAALLDAFDRQRQVDLAARLVARHLTLGHSPQALIATLAHAVLREDAGFHAYQMLEAGVRQFTAWGDADEGRHILIAVARYLAAHSPTERAALQTADIARRLMRGGELHQETGAPNDSYQPKCHSSSAMLRSGFGEVKRPRGLPRPPSFAPFLLRRLLLSWMSARSSRSLASSSSVRRAGARVSSRSRCLLLSSSMRSVIRSRPRRYSLPERRRVAFARRHRAG